MNPHQKRDTKLCKTITTSLSDIVRYSRNDHFRNSCFELFQAESSKEMQEKIKDTLESFCKNNFQDLTMQTKELENKGTNLPKKYTGKHLLKMESEKAPAQSNNSFRMTGEGHNWLNVAAQQTKNTIRRRWTTLNNLSEKNKNGFVNNQNKYQVVVGQPQVLDNIFDSESQCQNNFNLFNFELPFNNLQSYNTTQNLFDSDSTEDQ